MSHKFLLWEPSKPTFKHDSTALEILNNYSKLSFKKEEKPVTTMKIIDQPQTGLKYEGEGILVYDIKAEVTKGDPVQYSSNAESFPIQEINELNLKPYLQAKRFQPMPQHSPEYSITIPDDGITLQFNSKFESGNLKKAIKLSDYTYKLIISSDTNTFGQNHWYYFSAFNPRKTLITFEIANMLKYDNLYKAGLKPAVFSTKYFEKTGVKWHRDCTNITYKPNHSFFPGRKYYSLSFTYDYRYSGDTVYFAYSIPYTYTDLSNFLQFIKEKHQKIARVNTICKTLAGNHCEMITITENIKTYTPFEEEFHKWSVSSSGRKMLKNKKKRKIVQSKVLGKEHDDEHLEKNGVVLTARVHAGETVSSFMMKGAIEFLLGDSREARILRNKFVFKIVPMLNPDGVRYGNYRCSLIGVDLNRRWEKPSRNLHPTIFYTKKMIEVFAEDHKLMLCCDMHGHSKKRNVFMYGCSVKSMDCITIRKNLMAKVIPVVLNQKNKFFTFKDCHFRLEKSKMSTERIVIYNEHDIPHSYTIEASFFGPLNKKVDFENYHMNEKDLEGVGEDLCKACIIFTSQTAYLARIRRTNDFLRRFMMKKEKSVQKENKKSSEVETVLPAPAEKTPVLEDAKNEPSKSPESEAEPPDFAEIDLSANPVPLKLEDEKLWNDIEIVDYVESDEEGSGGSDSCPSEKMSSPLVQIPMKKKLQKLKKKIINEQDILTEEPKADLLTNNEAQEDQEPLKKTHSLKPHYRAVQYKRKDTQESINKSVPSSNLRSQNIMFNYPGTMPSVNENISKVFNLNNLTRNPKETGKRIHFSSQKSFGDEIANVSMITSSRPLNYSLEKNNYKKQERDQSLLTYNNNVFSDFSWSTKPGYIAKNFADSARFRIEKMYSKFSI